MYTFIYVYLLVNAKTRQGYKMAQIAHSLVLLKMQMISFIVTMDINSLRNS